MGDSSFGFTRGDYVSKVDGLADWYMCRPGREGGDAVVVLHGHGSAGDQLLTRPDVRDGWLPALTAMDLGVVTPNLRGNAWMAPAAVEDLADLIAGLKARRRWRRVVLASGSMGGTGNLIFAVRRPDLVDAVVALGAATDVRRYRDWCVGREPPVLRQIHDAIAAAYAAGGYDDNNVCAHADRLTMPVRLYHGGADAIIPVEEARALAERMAGRPNFYYEELPGGDHDSPVPCFVDALTAAFRQLDAGAGAV